MRSCTLVLTLAATLAAQSPEPVTTRDFEIRNERAWLGGVEVDLWGLRCGNALHSQTVTERHVRALDGMVSHGINLIGVYIQGSHGGWPDADAGLNGYHRDGRLKDAVAQRLEWLIREADKRGMVVMVGLFSPRKDQELRGEAALQRAVQETGRFLNSRKLRNVFVDLVHEFDHTERIDQELLREPDGASKKAQLAKWFEEVAPDIEVGACPYSKSPTTDTFPGMDVRIIQKEMAIPAQGFVVNVESQKQDSYENDGFFIEGHVDFILADCERYKAAANAVLMFHAAYVQGIGNFSGTAPHPEVGGGGTSPSDRGVRVYFDWVRNNIGRWEYPRHVAAPETVATGEPTPTREFAIQDHTSMLGGAPVKLWGLRCNNSLISHAVAQRLVNNLDNMAAHGINLIAVALQGTNGGFPDVDAGPNAFTSEGKLIPGFARRLEFIVREADRRGMVVCIGVLMPRKDQLLRDQAALKVAIEATARFLEERKLRNVVVNLFQEFNHPTRIDHDLLREPHGAQKKALVTAWFKAIAPEIEVGICPNHLSGSAVDYPGCDVQMFHEAMPIPSRGFALNTETPDPDLGGNEGVINSFTRARSIAIWATYKDDRRLAMLFRSCYAEDVRGRQGTGPNLEMGGNGTGENDRGIRFYFDWLRQNVGRWEYPRHGR